MSDLTEAIRRIQTMRDEVEANHNRALMFVAWDRELDAEAGYRLVTVDPYDQSDEEVNAYWATFGEAIAAAVYEFGDVLKGEDYETLDSLDGEMGAYDRVLDVLQSMAHGIDPAQGK